MTTGLSLRATLSHGGREADHTQRPEPRGDARPFPHQPLRTRQAAHAVVAQHRVLLPVHLRTTGALEVTIGLARVTIPRGPPVAALPLPPSMGSIKAKTGIKHRKIARYFDKLDTPAVGPICVSNNSCQESASTWLLCRRFFDTEDFASCLKATPLCLLEERPQRLDHTSIMSRDRSYTQDVSCGKTVRCPYKVHLILFYSIPRMFIIVIK
jgi:hypothetical protein